MLDGRDKEVVLILGTNKSSLADNKFYINRVRHVLSREGTYETRLEGHAASAGERDEAGGMGGGFGL